MRFTKSYLFYESWPLLLLWAANVSCVTVLVPLKNTKIDSQRPLKSLSYWCFLIALVFLCDIKSTYPPNWKHCASSACLLNLFHNQNTQLIYSICKNHYKWEPKGLNFKFIFGLRDEPRFKISKISMSRWKIQYFIR